MAGRARLVGRSPWTWGPLWGRRPRPPAGRPARGPAAAAGFRCATSAAAAAPVAARSAPNVRRLPWAEFYRSCVAIPHAGCSKGTVSTLPHPDYRRRRTLSWPYRPIGAYGQRPLQRQLLIAVGSRIVGNRHHRAAIGELTSNHHDSAQQVALPFGSQRRIRAEDLIDVLVHLLDVINQRTAAQRHLVTRVRDLLAGVYPLYLHRQPFWRPSRRPTRFGRAVRRRRTRCSDLPPSRGWNRPPFCPLRALRSPSGDRSRRGRWTGIRPWSACP